MKTLRSCCALLVIALVVSAAAEGPKTLRFALVGDSTVASYSKPPADRPTLTGWGQVLDQVLRPIEVGNYAVSGASSKSFRARGFWQKAIAEPADYLLIQFGHNDQPGKGDRTTDPEGDFQENLRRYIAEAKAKGMKPVLVTSVARRVFVAGKLVDGLLPYVEATRKVAAAEKVPLVDLYAASTALYARLGDEGSASFSPSATDRSHFSREGALAIAALVADGLVEAVPELKPYRTAAAGSAAAK